MSSKPILIKSKYKAVCLFCGRHIGVGVEVLWQRGVGVAHVHHFSEEEMQMEYLLDRFRK